MKNNNETKRDRFKRLAEKRTQRVLNDIRVLSNLSNKGLYDYSEDDVKKIFKEINDSLSVAKARFKGKKKNENQFKL